MIKITDNDIELTRGDIETLGGSIYVKSGNAWQQVSSTVLESTIIKETA